MTCQVLSGCLGSVSERAGREPQSQAWRQEGRPRPHRREAMGTIRRSGTCQEAVRAMDEEGREGGGSQGGKDRGGDGGRGGRQGPRSGDKQRQRKEDGEELADKERHADSQAEREQGAPGCAEEQRCRRLCSVLPPGTQPSKSPCSLLSPPAGHLPFHRPATLHSHS